MKIFAIFVWFSIAIGNLTIASWLDEWRTRSEMRTNEILEITDRMPGDFDVYQTLLGEMYSFSNRYFTVGLRGNFVDNTGDVSDFLQDMHDTYMSASFLYFAECVIKYYALSARTVRDLNQVTGNRGFCVLTALYDRGVLDDGTLEADFCPLLLGAGETDIYYHSKAYWDVCSYVEMFRKYPRTRHNSPDPLASERFEDSLAKIEAAIVRFSDAFCSPLWTPLIGDFLLSKLDRGQHKSAMFIRHVFEKEVCEIRFQLDDMQEWKCDNILKNQEYGLEKYEADVTKTIRCEVLRKSQTPTAEHGDEKAHLFSLVDLKNNLDFRNYKNAVLYYNVASDAILSVSIREGSQIFRAIRHIVTRDCGVAQNNRISVDEILGLRSTLCAFKSVFDRLVNVMLDKKRIDVAENPEKTWFEDLVNELVELLDVRDERTDNGTSMSEMCSGVPNLLDGKQYEALLGDEPYANVKFHEFYLTLPILHVNQLYRFYAYDFS